MSTIPKPQEIYKHFKGNLYQIITIAEHSETGEALVIYQALYGEYKVYARPLDSFLEKVDMVKYPDAAQEYRFELQNMSGVMASQKQAEEVIGTEQPEGEINLDPLVLEFLDADSYEERLNILAALRHRITDEMITMMAISCDVEVPDGETQERCEALKQCLITLEKYECNRLR